MVTSKNSLFPSGGVGLLAVGSIGWIVPFEKGGLQVVGHNKQIDPAWPLVEHGGSGVTNLAWSPNGSRLACVGGSNLTVINAATKTIETGWESSGAGTIRGVSWSPNGSRLALTKDNGANGLIVYDTVSRTIEAGWPSIVIEQRSNATAWSPSGNRLAVGIHDDLFGSGFRVIDVSTKTIESGWESFSTSYEMRTLSWSPDGVYLAVGGHGTFIYSAITRSIQQNLSAGSVLGAATEGIEWSPNGERIAVAQRTGRYSVPHLQVFNTATQSFEFGWPQPTGSYPVGTSVSWSHNGGLLAFSSRGTRPVLVYRVSTKEVLWDWPRFEQPLLQRQFIESVAFQGSAGNITSG